MEMTALQKLLQKDMTRKEFLIHLGVIIFALSGIGGILKTITNSITKTAESGYGSSPYGGSKR